MQDVDEVGFAFGSTRMSFTLGSKTATGFTQIMNPEFKKVKFR